MAHLSFSHSPSFHQPLSATPPPQVTNMFGQSKAATQSNFNAFANKSSAQATNQTNPFLMM
jgi:hypothetical protein